jgi:magnesium-transporting ATPase (P-type)
MGPTLFCIIGLAAVFAVQEDYKRHQADEKSNGAPVQIYDIETHRFVTKNQRDVRVCDVVKVEDNELIPADLLLMATSAPDHVMATIETKSLDGETNLKQREVFEGMAAALKLDDARGGSSTLNDSSDDMNGIEESIARLHGQGLMLDLEAPNANIHKFDAGLSFKATGETSKPPMKVRTK